MRRFGYRGVSSRWRDTAIGLKRVAEGGFGIGVKLVVRRIK